MENTFDIFIYYLVVCTIGGMSAKRSMSEVSDKISVKRCTSVSSPAIDFPTSSIMSIFDIYQDVNEPDVILDSGMEAFCQDNHIDPEDPQMLILAWKMGAAVMCRFIREEFLRGFTTLSVDTVPAMSCRLMVAAQEVRESSTSFSELYTWSYKFALDREAGQRNLPLGIAVPLWRIVFAAQAVTPPALLEPWLNFLAHRCVQSRVIRGTYS